ncbi:MAG TPA: hypothetical protein VNX46_13555 [Candidatus Acidoferrum sp.]|nr:hypothetical protein [Candidatus Acidoferrum sp.]
MIVTTFVVFTVLGITARIEYHAAVGYQKLAQTISSVTNVTIYGLPYNTVDISSNALASVPSVQFPTEVFTTAAGTAEYDTFGLWKGSPLVILTLRDGRQQHARFSYYGGLFGLDGIAGVYVVAGGPNSEFYMTFRRILEQQLNPKMTGKLN